jgi:ferric-dicitrate binding protein FerR (iron transport regulator)
MESGTEPSTTMKIKNPKKVEAGRKAAMARAKKLDELKRLAAANQQRLHTEIAKDSPPGGGEVAAYEEPAPSQPSRRATRQWDTQTGWWVGGGALLLFVGYIMYIKKSEKNLARVCPLPVFHLL